MNQIVFEEPLISEARKPQLKRLVTRLIEKLGTNDAQDFALHKILRAHILPLTNCAFNKTGDKCVRCAAPHRARPCRPVHAPSPRPSVQIHYR